MTDTTERFARADVERLARLARLRLTDEEMTTFAGQLARILEYATTVRQVDTAEIPPTSHLFADQADHTREDRTCPSLDRDQAIAAAPDADPVAGLFKVPRVL
jgi:aspartyl-tRNA(Asn)/glutamyl-tRNA(Gln) amidotransferase subunit C